MGFWRTMISKLDGWSRVGGGAEPTLADEAEAYLQGRLLERQRALGARGQVPPWLMLNAVAHGHPPLLQALAAERPTSRRPAGWRATRAALARELLHRTGGDATVIARAQRELLMPLENHLGAVGDLTPAQLYELAVQEMWLIES
jgi:hypothetical protein